MMNCQFHFKLLYVATNGMNHEQVADEATPDLSVTFPSPLNKTPVTTYQTGHLPGASRGR